MSKSVFSDSCPPFYGMAVSVNKREINVCVARGDKTFNIVKDQGLSWSNKDFGRDQVRRLSGTAKKLMQLQQASTTKARQGAGYTLPIILGCSSDVILTADMKALDPKSHSVTDFMQNLIQKSLASGNDKCSVPVEIGIGDYFRGDQESLRQAREANCPCDNLEQVALLAKQGNPQAIAQMQVWIRNIANAIIESIPEHIKADEPKFINMKEPDWMRHFNTSRFKKFLAETLALKLRCNVNTIDLKFPDDEVSDQFFNVLRPAMLINIQRALGQTKLKN